MKESTPRRRRRMNRPVPPDAYEQPTSRAYGDGSYDDGDYGESDDGQPDGLKPESAGATRSTTHPPSVEADAATADPISVPTSSPGKNITITELRLDPPEKSGAVLTVNRELESDEPASTIVRRATVAVETITRRISQSPADIRDAVRDLSDECFAQAHALRIINDRSEGHEQIIEFFEKLAAGLGELAKALDHALGQASSGKPEPIFLGAAGKIAEQLQLWIIEWCAEKQNRSLVIESSARIAMFGAGSAFLHLVGADSPTAIGGLTTLLFKRAPKTNRKE